MGARARHPCRLRPADGPPHHLLEPFAGAAAKGPARRLLEPFACACGRGFGTPSPWTVARACCCGLSGSCAGNEPGLRRGCLRPDAAILPAPAVFGACGVWTEATQAADVSLVAEAAPFAAACGRAPGEPQRQSVRRRVVRGDA